MENGNDLRVIHILYTVWGHHTTSSVNGQAFPATASPPTGRCRSICVVRRAVRDRARGTFQAVSRRHAGAHAAPGGVGRAGDVRATVHEAPRPGSLRRDVGDAGRRRPTGVGRP